MTFEEYLRAYLAAGGQPQDAIGEAGPDMTPIQLPDGSVAYRSGYGGLTVMNNITPQGYDMQSWFGDGTPAGGQYMSTPDLSAGRSLGRAAAVLGAPAIAMNALPALLAGGGSGAAASAPLAVSGAGDFIPASQLGMTGSAAAAPLAVSGPADFLPAAAGGAAAPVAAGAGGGAVGPAAAGAAGAGASMIPRFADGSIDWSSLLTSPAFLATAGGALAGIAGNSDIRSSNTTTGNAATTGTTTGTTTGNTNQSSSQSLAPWLQGYAQDYVSRAQQQAGMPSSNTTMNTARGLLETGATQGDPLVNAARGQQANVIGGGLLGANPYIAQVASNVGRQMGDAYALGTRGAITSAFNQSGSDPRFNSAYGQMVGKADENFARGLGDTMSSLFFNNYQTERNAQDAASRGSLGFGQFGQSTAANLYGIGAQDWMRPFQQTQFFGQAINPAFGSQSNTAGNTQQQNMQNVNQNVASNQVATQNINAPNNVLAGLGGAAAGAGIWRQLFGGR